MKVGKQSRRDGKAIFNACCVNGVLDEAKVRQAVTAVIAQKPRGYVGTLTHLQRLVKDTRGLSLCQILTIVLA